MEDPAIDGRSSVPVRSPALLQKIQTWEGLLENLPVGVILADRDGAVVRRNLRAADLCGDTPARIASDDPMWEALRTGRAIRDRALTLQCPDGTPVAVLANIEPLFDDDGTVLGAVSCLQECGSARAAHEPEEHDRLYHDTLKALPAAVFATDPRGRITFYNDAAADLWGCRPALGTDPRTGAWTLLSPDGEPLPGNAYPTTMALHEERPLAGVEALMQRPDGTRVPFLAYPTPLRDGAGRLTGSITMLVDITERKRAELHQKTLLDELNHRVKNTLATVQSLAGHTIRKTGLAPELKADFEGRLIALSRAHDQLTRERWEAADLKSIIDATFEPFRGAAADALQISGEKIKVGAQAALTLSMIFHELATNAAKYGALSTPNGRLDVSWKVTDGLRPATLCIKWRESGGPAVKRPARTGFGSRLLERGVAYQLKGSAKLDYDPAGLRCTMEIPLASMPG